MVLMMCAHIGVRGRCLIVMGRFGWFQSTNLIWTKKEKIQTNNSQVLTMRTQECTKYEVEVTVKCQYIMSFFVVFEESEIICDL